MRAPKALFLCLILLATVLQFPLAIADPGWLPGWDKRVKITIDSGDIDSTLTDFPILIYLSDSSGINAENISFVFDEVGASFLKIAVTLSDGTTECYVEVEKWDLGNREAWFWAKIASISNITNTDLYLYYENDHADNVNFVGAIESTPAETVWDANFDAVYHMRDKTTASIADSTDNDKDGTKADANEPILRVAGIISEDQDFDGDDDLVNIPNDIMPAASPFTLESWFSCDGVNSEAEDWQMLVDMRGEGQYRTFILFNEKDDPGNPGTVRFYIYDGVDYIDLYSSELNYATDYYVMATHDAANNMRLYVNGVLVDGPHAQDDPGVEGVGDFQSKIGKGYRDLDRGSFNGKIDEVRISQTARLVSWALATYKSGKDDLLDYGSEEMLVLDPPTNLFGAGFNASSPYVSLYWTTNLTGITLYEVQNSTDKVSWDTLGSNTTAEYHDFQVVNGTERYYRVRACNFTGGIWDNSTFTDINFEKVYFIMPIVNVTGAWVEFNYTSIITLIGIDSGGNFLNATYWKDGYTYNVTEPNETPSYDIRFNITGLPDNLICLQLINYLGYDGSVGHTFQIEVWNFTGSTWDFVVDIPDECCQWFNNSLDSTPEDYVKDGLFMGRYYHPSPGNVNHLFYLDYGKLLVFAPYEAPPCEEALALSMSKYYALAIILLILGILLGLGMRKRW